MWKIFTYWRSLAGTLLLMAIEIPMIVAMMGRLPEPIANLAALAVVLGVGSLIHAPVLRFMSVAITLVKDHNSYKIFSNFLYITSLMLGLVIFLITIDPLFTLLTKIIIPIPQDITSKISRGLRIWSIFPLLIAIRRRNQGILIGNALPNRVIFCTFSRFIVIFSILSVSIIFPAQFIAFGSLEIGVASMGLGIFIEAILSQALVSPVILKIKSIKLSLESDNFKPAITYRELSKQYLPLAVSGIVLMGSQTILTFFISRASFSSQSLAVLPAILGSLQIFSWTGFAIQDTTIGILNSDVNAKNELRRFTLLLAIILCAIFGLLTLSGGLNFYYLYINKLPTELIRFTTIPNLLLISVPATVIWRAYRRGLLILNGHTLEVLLNEIFEVASLILILWIATSQNYFIGINAAALGLLCSGWITVAALQRFKT